MKLLHKLLVLTGVLTISACNFARFDRFPGNKLENPPIEFLGKYYMKEDRKTLDQGDTLFLEVTAKGWYTYSKGQKAKSSSVFDSVHVFSTYSGVYFVSQQGDEHKLWEVYVIRKNRNDIELQAYNLEKPLYQDDRLAKYFSVKQKIKRAGYPAILRSR